MVHPSLGVYYAKLGFVWDEDAIGDDAFTYVTPPRFAMGTTAGVIANWSCHLWGSKDHRWMLSTAIQECIASEELILSMDEAFDVVSSKLASWLWVMMRKEMGCMDDEI